MNRYPHHGFQRVSVGRRPSPLVSTSDGTVYVAEMFSDTVSVVDLATATQTDQFSLGPQPQPTPAQLGEMLFFDSRLSHDGWMSCHSRHTDRHSSGQLNDNLSDGSFGAPKRVLSLLGVGQTAPWAWIGEVKTLEEQVTNSIAKTMRGGAPTEEQVAALVAYIKTLPAPPPGDSATGRNASEVRRGEQLFETLDCVRCHTHPTYTSPRAYDVGLTDSDGNRTFNPPSLRGAGRRHALFHDARATSLNNVLAEYKHQLDRELSGSELEALLQFLKSL